jgi:hypothetical protein
MQATKLRIEGNPVKMKNVCACGYVNERLMLLNKIINVHFQDHKLTAFPLTCRYVVSSLELSVMLSSSSDPSTLSKALALAPGDFGEVGLIKLPGLLICPEDFPGTAQYWMFSANRITAPHLK